MPIEWVAVSQHVYSWQPELASADGKNINCDDKNCGKCTLCRSEYFATASDYLSLLWKAPSIRATWSPSSSRKNSWGRAVSYRRPATDSGCLLCLPPLSSATAEALYNVYTHTHTDLDMDKVWLLGTLDGGIRKRGNLTSRILHAAYPETCTAVVLWSIWCPGETDWEHPFQQIGLLLPRGL